MRIRWKLLILLLAIALVPLGFISWVQHRSLDGLGRELGSHASADLIARAGRQLQQVADHDGATVRRETEIIEQVLRAQAREVERCLATGPPKSPEVFWAEDYDRGEVLPDGMVLSTKHFRMSDRGTREAMPVTYQQQVFILAPRVDRGDVADDVARLSLMPSAYQFVRQAQPGLIHWQYTGMDAGVHTSYPGHGGYPEGFDPRQRSWYTTAITEGDLVWSPPYVDASTRQVMLTVSMPVKYADGTMAGVTAIDVELLSLVRRLEVPSAWSSDARTLIVETRNRAGGGTTGILIRAQQSYAKEGQHWNLPIDLEWLDSGDEAQMREMTANMGGHRSGLYKMSYQGRDSLWAHASADDRNAHVLLIVPYEEIIAQAMEAEADVLSRTRRLLRTAGIMLVVVVVIVLLAAFRGSKVVTRPVADLADAAGRIAAGDLEACTNITTRDELGELGRAFNDMVPQLADRMRLRESLTLAMEVQQNLLPDSPPRIEGLDVAGKSLYCDETGGDYYDFIELTEMSPYCLGVVVGDVTGHGIAAALLMATARALLRSRADRPGGMADMMDDINRRLCADTGGRRFMTLVYLLIDAKSRTLRWVNAGHDAPIIYDPNSGRFDELVGGGIPLGIEGAWSYDEYSSEASPDGQIIVIGTDGIWEARNPQGNMFGKEALREIIREHADRSAEDISLAVTETLTAFRKTRSQEDDITLVVVKVLPRDAAAPPTSSA